MRKPCGFLVGMLLLAGEGIGAHATVISYWRFETDTNPGSTDLSSPNEISGEPAMTSSSAGVFSQVPVNPIPLTGATNTMAVGPTSTGGGAGSVASATVSGTLSVSSITVEFWFRTQETTASMVARTTPASAAGPSATITNGFRFAVPADLEVTYFTGTGTQVTLTSGLDLRDSAWHHTARTYASATGVGEINDDGVLVDSN